VTKRKRIAVVAGPTATILATEPLVTSNQARIRHGLPPRTTVDPSKPDRDVLRPQRLAAPVRVLIEQFSAHPLEEDSKDLYGAPDGYVDANYEFHKERLSAADVAVYEAELRPEDGLYMLPYMALQADGTPWDGDSSDAVGDETSRQPFFPDASRLFEEIDRFGVGPDGWGSRLGSLADFDFFRAAPSGGYRRGLRSEQRTDFGSGDLDPEARGLDFFPYRPSALRAEPTRSALASITNTVQKIADDDCYAGLIWLEGSPNLEETLYWLSLVIDARIPIVGCAAQRAHGSLGAEGDRNLVDAVVYITSDAWQNDAGEDCFGPVALQDQVIFSARELVKVNSRPGGFRGAASTSGVLGLIDHRMKPRLEFQPRRRFTHDSEVNLRRLPATTTGLRMESGRRVVRSSVQVLDTDGHLRADALPVVPIVKMGRYQDDRADTTWVHVVQENLRGMLSRSALAGIVAEGAAPYGTLSEGANDALRSCVLAGVPVLRVGRGTPEGIARSDEEGLFLAGTNLGATKARLVLTACLLRFGALPPAKDVHNPTDSELAAIRSLLGQYQAVLDTH
jgi:L-asparaginase